MDTRGRNTWGTQQNPDITPPSRNSSTGEGGWALWRPLRTNTDRVEQTDKGGHGGAGSSGGHGSAGSSGGHGVARGSGGHGSAGSSGGHSRWSMWPWPRSPRPGPLQPEPFYPPQNFPGEVRGYQEPSGARHRQTGQDIPQEPLPPPRQGWVSVDKTWQDKVS